MHQTRKILIAEDDPHLCRYLVALLDQRNCEIAVEHNAEDAIRRSVSFQPDVALLGFVMPGIDGSTTGVGHLKVSPLTNAVFTTEFVSPEILEALKAHGYHFKTLPAPSEFAELEALCFPMAGGT
jgi:CheY-like chemotaxis protein